MRNDGDRHVPGSGVSEEPLELSGGSAAQSSVIQMVDVCLGVDHTRGEGEFLVRMRDYMPPNQRAMLAQLAELPSLRSLCEGSEELQERYNNCLLSLDQFRTQHLILASRYITDQVTTGGRQLHFMY